MGNIILKDANVKFKCVDDCIKIKPLNEADLYVNREPLQDVNKTLFRFMDERYVDDFLNSGNLRLSNFEGCRKLHDDKRRDRHEGFGTLCATDGKFTIQMCIRLGMNPLMLCCANDLKAYAKHKTALRIFNPTGLRDAITVALKQKGRKVRQILQGDCEYRHRMIYKHVMSNDPMFNDMLKYAQGCPKKLNYLHVDSFVRSVGGNRLYFMKPTTYRKENEFRIIWDCNRMECDEYENVTIDNPKLYAEKCYVS